MNEKYITYGLMLGFIALMLGGSGWFLFKAFRTGRVPFLDWFEADRAESPILFWIAVAFLLGFGALGLLAAWLGIPMMFEAA